jgi:hypothetical protein
MIVLPAEAVRAGGFFLAAEFANRLFRGTWDSHRTLARTRSKRLFDVPMMGNPQGRSDSFRMANTKEAEEPTMRSGLLGNSVYRTLFAFSVAVQCHTVNAQSCDQGFDHIGSVPALNGNAWIESYKSPAPFLYASAAAGSAGHAWSPAEDVMVTEVRVIVAATGPGGIGTIDPADIQRWYVQFWNNWHEFEKNQLWGNDNFAFDIPSGGDLVTPIGTTTDGANMYELSFQSDSILLNARQEYIIAVAAQLFSADDGAVGVVESDVQGPSDTLGASYLDDPGYTPISDLSESMNDGVLAYQIVALPLKGCTCESGGDFDNDGDVDLIDFGVFQICFTGPTSNYEAGCECGDFDFDGDLDLVDFGNFSLAFTGSL